MTKRLLPILSMCVAALCGVASGQITPGKYGRGGTVGRKGVLPDHIANSDGVVHGGEYRVHVSKPYGKKALDSQLQRAFEPKYHTRRLLCP